MVRFDILPRLLPDRYYDTLQEALEEVSYRKMSQVADDAVTRFDKLPYGSYRVYTVSLRAAMDVIADGADPTPLLGHSSSHIAQHNKETALR